jgi:DNA polymerase-1
MIVTEGDFDAAIDSLERANFISLDTETTGLRPYQGDRLFSVIASTLTETYYFNFNDKPDHLGSLAPHILARRSLDRFAPLLADASKTIFFANPKFDMHILAQEGLAEFNCHIHDVLGVDRLLFNDHMQYSLAAVAKRNGFEKSEAVEEYISEHKLFKWVEIPGKQKRHKDKYYYLVPFDVMVPYGERDARITFDIGVKQLAKLSDLPKSPKPTPIPLAEMEAKLIHVCYRMEREGLAVDTQLCKQRADEETLKYERLAREFHDKTGVKFVDSAKCLGPLFGKLGFTVPKTETGRDSVTDDWLNKINHPLGTLVQAYRSHAKTGNTYYKNYLWFTDSQGLIHANIKPDGTRTGRFSYGDPNLQNVPDNEVRESFRALPDFCLVSLDFDQQEYRLMLDYAKEMGVVNQVLAGLDIHTATAQMMGVERTPAKTLNFMLLYGGGVVKLAMALFPTTISEEHLWTMWREQNHWPIRLKADQEKHVKHLAELTQADWDHNLPLLFQADGLRSLYFEKLPKVKSFIERVKNAAAERGYINTWGGRKLHFKKGFHYKAPNGLIQGGAADVGKYAMLEIDKLLANRKSKLLVQIHDELIFKMHVSELPLVHQIKHIMETTYPHDVLPLTVSANYSWKNLGQLEKGFPSVEESRDQVQRESARGSGLIG